MASEGGFARLFTPSTKTTPVAPSPVPPTCTPGRATVDTGVAPGPDWKSFAGRKRDSLNGSEDVSEPGKKPRTSFSGAEILTSTVTVPDFTCFAKEDDDDVPLISRKRDSLNKECDDDVPLISRKRDSFNGDRATGDPSKKTRMPSMGAKAEAPTGALQTPPDERETDLRSALETAKKATPGSIPPFVAECMCHFASSGTQYSWPLWLVPENMRDARGLPPTDPQYDQGTLQVPDEKKIKGEKTHGTPMLLQYWKLKASHFDKVAFFKVGKFYEVFYYDAFVAQRVCNLKMIGERKPHVGFPEMAKHNYARKMVDAGYKVVVVEQVERVAEQKQRKEKSDTGSSCVERDACEVYTNGTLVDPELLGTAGAKYMLCLHFHDRASTDKMTKFAACLVDCATSKIAVGIFQDGTDRNALRTLIAHTQPCEVVYSASNMPSDVLGMIRRLPCRPQQSPMQGLTVDDTMLAKNTMSKYRLEYPDKFSEDLQALFNDDGATIVSAAVFSYLKANLLADRVMPFASWEIIHPVCGGPTKAPSSVEKPSTLGRRLVLDATALSALEILETLEGTYDGSLLAHLNRTGTQFGFRLLKQWLCSPLLDVKEIRERQDAVEFFIARPQQTLELRDAFKKVDVVDLERATSRVWGFAVQAERHAVYYEDVTAKRLGMFRNCLLAYEHYAKIIEKWMLQGDETPARLKLITRTRENGGGFPDLQPLISKFLNSVVEDNSGKRQKFRPQAGVFKPFDDLQTQLGEINQQLEAELQSLRARFPGTEFNYAQRLLGFRYEVECDDTRLPKEFLETVSETKRSGSCVRFHTNVVKNCVEQMEMLENKREDCIFPFLAQIFRQFHSHQALFRAALHCIAEVDALVSLALSSMSLSGNSCRADLVDLDDPESPAVLELRNCRHPVAAAIMGASFVPNDTFMNSNGVPGCLIVTGPNMGGKSTVLRQTCIALVMAQIGCRVNAESCCFSPVDRIFTRIGSYDTILEGKSTLLTELEETSAILSYGTKRSFAVLDELGRGTSTFDGAAIASAVLDELISNVKCLVMFATHYHPVSREASKMPTVRPFHMAAEVDKATNQMTFLYRFLPGLCPASHGHNVAKLAGLPSSVLKVALAKSEEFERGNGVAAMAHEILALAEAGDAVGLQSLYNGLPKIL